MNILACAMSLVVIGTSCVCITSASTPKGPGYDFPEHSSPGVGMWLKEARRYKRGTTTHIVYTLSAIGLSPGKELNLYRWDWGMSDGVLTIAGFIVDPDGGITCSRLPEKRIPDEETKHWCPGDLEKLKIDAVGFQPGQALRVGLISTDSNQKAFAEIIPFPIEGEDRGCRLVAERLSEDAGTWSIRGEGFIPGEPVHYLWRGPGNRLKGEITPNEKGALALMVRPPASSTFKSNGTATFKIEASNCAPVLHFSWAVLVLR